MENYTKKKILKLLEEADSFFEECNVLGFNKTIQDLIDLINDYRLGKIEEMVK